MLLTFISLKSTPSARTSKTLRNLHAICYTQKNATHTQHPSARNWARPIYPHTHALIQPRRAASCARDTLKSDGSARPLFACVATAADSFSQVKSKTPLHSTPTYTNSLYTYYILTVYKSKHMHINTFILRSSLSPCAAVQQQKAQRPERKFC